MSIRIAPSILSADFASLAEEVRKVERAGAHSIHVDVMDGHFVPNITLGPVVVESIRKMTRLPLDVHLMTEEPDRYVPWFVGAGASVVSVHAEATVHLDRTVNLVRSHGVGVGVAINPATPVSAILHVLDRVDMVLIMSVNPGFGGQKFIPYTLGKIRHVRELLDEQGSRAVIEVDGGIDTDTVEDVVRAGAEILVAGSAIFHAADPARKIQEMLEKATGVSYHSKYA